MSFSLPEPNPCSQPALVAAPGPATDPSSTSTNAASKKVRISTDAVKLMKAFYDKVTKNPTPTQCRELLEQIHAIPGKGNETCAEKNVRSWFDRRKWEEKKRAEPSPAEQPQVDRRLAALKMLEDAYEFIPDPEARRYLQEKWIKSPFFREFGASEDDVRTWLAERDASNASPSVPPSSAGSIPPPSSTGLPPLRVNTSLAPSTAADGAYAYSMLTPSDTTSPEPVWRHPVTNLRYHQAPTPTPTPSASASRAPSLALKSEPAYSPLMLSLPLSAATPAATTTSRPSPAPAPVAGPSSRPLPSPISASLPPVLVSSSQTDPCA
ncbi:hypothetical protein B0H15DRAFT_546353 [Mycena belliarum]|uniref:Homeobox domain-containing protein n=1 Tax=Mycena belliarum TaxID=1033014 RepID=A0AAD6UCX5_9AGAR|nr:hypothetical protein B0H15DRAFT_546353 [Mycena belliae]